MQFKSYWYVKLKGTRLKDWRTTTSTVTSARTSSFILISQNNDELGVIKVHPRPLGNTTDSSSNSIWRLRASGADFSLFLRFPFPGLRGDIVVPIILGWSPASIDSDRYSTWPTPTTSDMRTPVRRDGSLTSDDSTQRTPNHLSDFISCNLSPHNHSIIRLLKID